MLKSAVEVGLAAEPLWFPEPLKSEVMEVVGEVSVWRIRWEDVSGGAAL